MTERIQNVADRMSRMMDDALRNAEFARARNAFAEADHHEGRRSALERLAVAFGVIDGGADPVGTALTKVREQMDEVARALPSSVERGKSEGELAALTEMSLLLLRLRGNR